MIFAFDNPSFYPYLALPAFLAAAIPEGIFRIKNALRRREIRRKRKESSQWLDDEDYRFMVENQAEGFIVVDSRCRILYANLSADIIFGQPHGKLSGQQLETFLDDENFARVKSEIKKRMSGEESAYELEINRPDGEKRVLLLNAKPHFNRKAEYEWSFGAFVDITERKNAEIRLQESQKRYQELYAIEKRHIRELTLLDKVHTALSSQMDLASLYRMIVEEVAGAFGYTQVCLYIVNNGQLEIVHHIGYSHIVQTIPLDRGITGRVARTGQPAFVTHVENDADYLVGEKGVASEVCVPIIDESKVVGVLNIESTQEERLTEDDLHLMMTLSEHISIAVTQARLFSQLHTSETSYRTLAANLPGIVFRLFINDGRRVEFFNSMLEEITGYNPGDIHPGKVSPLENLLMIEDRNKVTRSIRLAINGNIPYEVEYRIRSRDGSLHICVERGRPVAAVDGCADHIDGVIMDITERREAEERIKKYARQMEALYATSLAINSHTEPETLLKDILEEAALMIGAKIGGLFLAATERNHLDLAVSFNLPDVLVGETQQFVDHVSTKMAANGQTVFTTSLNESTGRQAVLNSPNLQRILAVPLKTKGKVIGVIVIADTENPNPFAGEDIRLISLFADQAAIAIENNQLYTRLERQALLDDLTGLYNRRGLMELGQREVDRAIRFFRPLTAVFVDIDHFKEFNDQFTHLIGDQVLVNVARILNQGVRDVDLVGRYGGEELVLLLVETDLETAADVANRLRHQIQKTPISSDYGELCVTVSMGVAQLNPAQPLLADLIHRADQAMYEAKIAGRNCVVTRKD